MYHNNLYLNTFGAITMSDQNHEQQEQNINNEAQSQEEVQNQDAEKISKLESEIASCNEKLLRTLAELDNVRRRAREESEKTAKYAISNFASDLVLVVENFLLASENAPKEEIEKNPAIKHYADAIVMTEKELLKVLEKNQIRRVYPLNQKFDHNLHEAIAHIESDAEADVVVKVVQAGYTIADRLIRPALVGVAKQK